VIHRRTVLASIGASLAIGTGTTARAQSAEKIAILGTGALGQALARGWARRGHRIIYGSRTPEDERVGRIVRETGSGAIVTTLGDAAAAAQIVVFALPWKAVKELMPAIGDLRGKILVDPMNAVKVVDGYPGPPDDPMTSVAETLQSWAPDAKLVKAFNTPAAKSIIDPQRAGGRVSIPLAGADVAAKARIAALVSELGLEPVDTGPLIAARYLEGMMRLSFGYLLYSKGKSFEFHLVPVNAK
jgi:predicted dinucleotide-binding enzyme